MKTTVRPRLHFCPRYGWINDPNGFCFYRGEFHLFYQHNPKATHWENISWGHAASSDLVAWRHLPVAFVPDKDYDAGGCFSGTALADDDGILKILYTGQSYYQDAENTRQREEQALVISDGTTFKKHVNNPIIKESLLPPDIYKYDFRDPFIFKEDKTYFCLVGTRNASGGGNLVLFRSENITEWFYVGKLFEEGETIGTICECPALYRTAECDFLLLSSCALQKFPNRNSNVYLRGKLDLKRGRFQRYSEVSPLDYGFDFYACELARAGEKTFLIAWMNMQGRKSVCARQGYSSALTFPREIKSSPGGELLQFPVPIPEKYLGQQKTICAECARTISCFSAYRASLKVALRGNGCAELIFADTLKMCFDKTGITADNAQCDAAVGYSANGETAVRQIPFGAEDYELIVIVDAYSVEIFSSDGKYTFSAVIDSEKPEKLTIIPQNACVSMDLIEIKENDDEKF